MQQHPYYLSDTQGNIKFTQAGLRELAPYLAKAGIDIHTIHTEEQYITARQQASPYFIEWLRDRADTWVDKEEFQLLKKALKLDI